MSDHDRPQAAGGVASKSRIALIGVGILLAVLSVGALVRNPMVWLLAVILMGWLSSTAIVRNGAPDKRRALGVAAGLGGALAVSAPLWCFEASLAYWIIAVAATTWLVTSLRIGWLLPQGASGSPVTGFLSWLSDHKAVAGSVALGYLSVPGLVYETTLYSNLELSALLYVDPGSLVYAIFSSWLLATAAVSCAFLLLFVPWLSRRLRNLPKRGGKLLLHLRSRDWTALAVWAFAKPAEYFVEAGRRLVVVATVLLLFVPLGVAYFTAEDTFNNLHKERKGTLRLSRPAVYAVGVRHIASTSTHMILARWCGSTTPSEEKNGSQEQTFRDDLIAEFKVFVQTMVGAVTEAIKQNEQGKATSLWLPIVVPWNVVASFDLEPDEAGYVASARESKVSAETKPKEQRQGQEQDGCKELWKPELPTSLVPGPAGPKGDSVSIQYSGEGKANGEWLDRPTPDVRYIRFQVGEGKWEPPEGIRIAGSREVWYGVPFERFTLTENVKTQLADLSIPPPAPDVRTDGTCRIEVRGCASSTPFFHLCSESAASTQCTRCSEDSPNCHPKMARMHEDTDEVTYHEAHDLLHNLVKASGSEPACGGLKCVDYVNAVLNCGVANLRSLAAASKLLGTPDLETMLSHFDLDLPNWPGSKRNGGLGTYAHRVSELLVDACANVADRPVSANVTVRAASPEPEGSQCWIPQKAPVNHSAIIRFDGERALTLGGCPQNVGSRL